MKIFTIEKRGDTDKMAENEIVNVQWFPGHMVKARRLIQDNLKLVDVVIELLDARIPYSSSNPLLKELLGNKPCVIALNKADLADPINTKKWIAFFRTEGISAVAIDSITGQGTKQLVKLTEERAKAKTQKLVVKGAKARAARVMIVGIPNVGKSSLINRLAGAVKAKAENRPGVTRAKQWIKIGTSLELLDMPGILWPKFEDPVVGMHLAYTGAINDDAYDTSAVVFSLLNWLKNNYCHQLMERYGLSEEIIQLSEVELFEKIGRKRGCLLKGGVIDEEKVQTFLLADFRSKKLGRISLDNAPLSPHTEDDNI